MADKRKRPLESSNYNKTEISDRKRQKRGFVVGPDNLPDGTLKRKNQRIKRGLIERAKIKKEYAKLKERGDGPPEDETLPEPASLALDVQREPDTAPHPDRQALMESEPIPEEDYAAGDGRFQRQKRSRREKPIPFKREHEEALRRQAEAEERRRAREEAQEERARKIEDRERFRKAMAKARTGGPNGQRKLGRESKVLLDKVKRLVGDTG